MITHPDNIVWCIVVDNGKMFSNHSIFYFSYYTYVRAGKYVSNRVEFLFANIMHSYIYIYILGKV